MKIILIFNLAICLANAQIKTRVTPSSFRNVGAQSQDINEREYVHSYQPVESSVHSNLNQSRGDQNGHIAPYPYLNNNQGGGQNSHYGQENNASHVQYPQGFQAGYNRVEGREHSANWKFENRTVQNIQPGICYKEVE